MSWRAGLIRSVGVSQAAVAGPRLPGVNAGFDSVWERAGSKRQWCQPFFNLNLRPVNLAWSDYGIKKKSECGTLLFRGPGRDKLLGYGSLAHCRSISRRWNTSRKGYAAPGGNFFDTS